MELSNLLSILIWTPIVGGFVILAMGDGGDAESSRAGLMCQLSLAVSVATFLISILLYTGFDTTTASLQFVERVPWIETLNVYYYLGVDGISAPLILLTTFITPLVVIAGWNTIKIRPAQYFAAFLILEGLNVLQVGTGADEFVSDYFDFSIYIDAAEADVEQWYVDRFLTLRESVFQNPDSFFRFYADLTDDEAVATARGIWSDINGLNLRENIAPTRERASLIVHKQRDHRVDQVRLRRL